MTSDGSTRTEHTGSARLAAAVTSETIPDEEPAMTDLTDTALPQQRDDALGVVDAYFAGWNAHDGAAVAAAVSGSYVDPTLPGPLRGEDLAANVDALCRAIPDLRFVHDGMHVAGDVVVAEWRMQGTNNGDPLPGAPAATGGTIDFPGVDVISVRDGVVDTVVGYFDRQLFLEQLGLQVIPAPANAWPVTFGLATRVDLGNMKTPGAISFTWIELDDPSEAGELNERTTAIITSLAGEPSFIGFQSTSCGDRNVTLTAWTSPEAAEAALARSSEHTAAVARVMTEGFGGRGFTSIWQPYRLNAQFATCAGCSRYVPLPLDATSTTCECGESVEALPYI
jgi:predicted ester cyclase